MNFSQYPWDFRESYLEDTWQPNFSSNEDPNFDPYHEHSNSGGIFQNSGDYLIELVPCCNIESLQSLSV